MHRELCESLVVYGSKTLIVSRSLGVKMKRLTSLCALVAIFGCGGNVIGNVCGADTHDENGTCVAGQADASIDANRTQDGGANSDASMDTGADNASPLDSSADSGDPLDFSTACLVSDNVLIVYGPPGNHQQNGLVRLQGGTGWGAQSIRNAEEVMITTAGDVWTLDFATVGLGVSMAANATYADTRPASSYTQGYPGLTITGGNASGCWNTSSGGSFHVINLNVIQDVVHEFTAVFTYPCSEAPSAPIRGCVRVRH